MRRPVSARRRADLVDVDTEVLMRNVVSIDGRSRAGESDPAAAQQRDCPLDILLD
jgi:hypothetical protein